MGCAERPTKFSPQIPPNSSLHVLSQLLWLKSQNSSPQASGAWGAQDRFGSETIIFFMQLHLPYFSCEPFQYAFAAFKIIGIICFMQLQFWRLSELILHKFWGGGYSDSIARLENLHGHATKVARKLVKVARLQSEFCTNDFFRATNFLTKNAPKFSPKILSLCSVGQKKSPENSLQISHSKFPCEKNPKKITDELLQERREKNSKLQEIWHFPLEPFFDINPGILCSGIDNE